MARTKDPLSACVDAVGVAFGVAIEFVAPGRRAGFHVDRIVMRARRITELLSTDTPDLKEVRSLSGLLGSDFAFGPVVLAIQGLWSAKARAAWQSDVRRASVEVGKAARELVHTIKGENVDLAAARAQAATALAAAEELRTRAYAFEDQHGKS